MYVCINEGMYVYVCINEGMYVCMCINEGLYVCMCVSIQSSRVWVVIWLQGDVELIYGSFTFEGK